MRKLLKLSATMIFATLVVCVFALSACSNPAVHQPAQSSTPKTLDQGFFEVALPSGFTTTDKDYVFKDDRGGSIYVSVHNRPASELVSIEASDTDFEVKNDIESGGLVYHVVKSDKWDKAFWIADWEDGCVEITVNGIDNDLDVKSFLDGVKYKKNAYSTWQQSSKK